MMLADKEMTPPDGSVQDDYDSDLEQLEKRWDEMLGKGDDDFYEAFRGHRQPHAETEKVTPKPQRRGRRM